MQDEAVWQWQVYANGFLETAGGTVWCKWAIQPDAIQYSDEEITIQVTSLESFMQTRIVAEGYNRSGRRVRVAGYFKRLAMPAGVPVVLHLVEGQGT